MKKLFVIVVLLLCFAGGLVQAVDKPDYEALLKQKEIELLQVKIKAVRAEMAYMNERFPNCQREEAELLRQLSELTKPNGKKEK